MTPGVSVEEHTERSSETEHGLVHVEVLRVVVSIRVPETPTPHLDTLSPLLPYHYVHRQLRNTTVKVINAILILFNL